MKWKFKGEKFEGSVTEYNEWKESKNKKSWYDGQTLIEGTQEEYEAFNIQFKNGQPKIVKPTKGKVILPIPVKNKSFNKKWSPEDKKYLIENINKKPSVLARQLRRTECSIKEQIKLIRRGQKQSGIMKKRREFPKGTRIWTPEERQYLSDHTTHSIPKLAKHFNRTEKAVYLQLSFLKRGMLKIKSKKVFPKGRREWTKQDNELLTNNFDKPINFLANLLNRTERAVKDQKMKLRKTMPKKDKMTKNVERGKFLGSRSAFYMKQYNWSRQKAWTQASQDWNQNKKPIGNVLPSVVEEKNAVFKLFKKEGQNMVLIGEFTSKQGAENEKEKLKIADQSINDLDTQYFVLREE